MRSTPDRYLGSRIGKTWSSTTSSSRDGIWYSAVHSKHTSRCVIIVQNATLYRHCSRGSNLKILKKLARPPDVQNSKPYDSLNLNTPRRFPSFFDSTFRPSYSVGKAYARKQWLPFTCYAGKKTQRFVILQHGFIQAESWPLSDTRSRFMSFELWQRRWSHASSHNLSQETIIEEMHIMRFQRTGAKGFWSNAWSDPPLQFWCEWAQKGDHHFGTAPGPHTYDNGYTHTMEGDFCPDFALSAKVRILGMINDQSGFCSTVFREMPKDFDFYYMNQSREIPFHLIHEFPLAVLKYHNIVVKNASEGWFMAHTWPPSDHTNWTNKKELWIMTSLGLHHSRFCLTRRTTSTGCKPAPCHGLCDTIQLWTLSLADAAWI